MSQLTLHRRLPPVFIVRLAAPCLSESGQADDFDVFDGKKQVGRIYRVTDQPNSPWFWSVNRPPSGGTNYGHADSLSEAGAALQVEYLRRRDR